MAVTWNRTYKCTDCGKTISYEGTCPDCLIANNPVPEKLIEDIKKGKK